MVEEEKKKSTEEEKEEEEGEVNSKSDDLITKANAAAMRIEAANEALKKQLDRQEAMTVEQTLGGKADAGQPTKKEETPAAYAKRIEANDVPPAA